MPNEYTRQRQGRDFSLSEYLTKTTAANRKTAANIIRADEEAKTLLHRLEHYKQEAERNAVPTDGHEPPEKGRNLV
jgi:hypothetical protein